VDGAPAEVSPRDPIHVESLVPYMPLAIARRTRKKAPCGRAVAPKLSIRRFEPVFLTALLDPASLRRSV